MLRAVKSCEQLLVTWIVLVGPVLADYKEHITSDFAARLKGKELFNYVNEIQSKFQAGESPVPCETIKTRLMNIKYMKKIGAVPTKEIKFEGEVPERFDAREQWPDCVSIRLIRDQANCGASWAVSAASAMSDRLCIRSKGKDQRLVSDADILTCCRKIGMSECGTGCSGGYDIKAWQYVLREGACSGGPYGAKNVCKPYPFYPCGRHQNQTYYDECEEKPKTPNCRKMCQISSGQSYEKRIHAGMVYYVGRDEISIQKEIMTNGPVQASMETYTDFLMYKSGIYEHVTGKLEGSQSVKIVGWGVENGTKYWIVANSWNTDWGEKGHFRIRRGTNECKIEGHVTAGIMNV
ncbi:papain family cysteine protease [Oesophagostomum dentatum]|uniref:Papain family cysteine protease n=1 Tax=Oesophagostomum dentatum TaxID=61180 RepID=A0A0B1TSE7_OESDE|nr:papain family cysteine protease [Oesophagostomum dentatum]